MKNLARIEPSPNPDDDRPGSLVRTPYDEAFIEAVKALPWQDRRWIAHESAWWVADEHMDRAKDLVIHHYGAVELVDEDGVCEICSKHERSRQERLL